MRSRLPALVAVLALSSGALVGCAVFDAGPRVSEDRPISDATIVELDSSGDLTVRVGDTPSLRITAGERVIDRLTAENSGDTLRLGFDDRPAGWSGRITYELTVTSLETLRVLDSGDARVDFTGATAPTIELRGSGEVEASGIDAEEVSVTLDGSGDVELDRVKASSLTVRLSDSGSFSAVGEAATLDAEVTGSGDLDAGSLRSEDVRVVARGSGEIDVHATRTLDVESDGSGDIEYGGDPEVTSSVTGSGELRRR
ncbi:head GIN domain-containing protein [Streptomyces sp. AC495_CC817]|uniref:head GIN domain-containing protein n=1 Tax=Streptomyces sp. AC495_CC817 TaxID=2823900 RepID=UPI001C2753D2|nr:head GIN domain-containing protein [Streptomyces sp. AC495_CC817]